MKKIRTPKAEAGENIAQVGDGPTDSEHPFICLAHLARGYCVFDCETQEQAAFAKALRDISRRTWKELKQAPRKGVGFETIYNVKKELPESAKKKRIISFRISSVFRMVGYRDQRVFHVLWVDPKGEVYEH